MRTPPPDIRQQLDCDCGPAAALSARLHFGVPPKPLPYNMLDGTDVRLMEYAVRPELSCQSGEMTLDDLVHHLGQGRLVLCLVTEAETVGHWVLAHGIRDGRVLLQDPLRGPTAESVPAFLRRWSDWDRSGATLVRWGLAVWRP